MDKQDMQGSETVHLHAGHNSGSIYQGNPVCLDF